MDAPKGVLPLKEHCVTNAEGKIKLDVELSDNVMPTWREMEKVSGALLNRVPLRSGL